MNPPRAARSLALALSLVLAACTGGGSKGGAGLDPSKPDDALLLEALRRYDAAGALAADARALADPAARVAKEAEAVLEYDAAQALFARLPAEYPASPRVDNAAYLEGRCAYEVGTLTGQRARFAEASDLLARAAATHPASALLDSVAYFCGRAVFQVAELDAAAPGAATPTVRALYGEAWAWFDRSLGADAAGTWSDNAAYYRGRCDFEAGLLEVNPLELGAAAPAPGTPEWREAIARFDRAEAELSAIPAASSYHDNARYYLGRSHFEEPADVATTRISNLEAAVAAFDVVTAVPASTFADGARYWRGRSRYSLAFFQGAPGVYAEGPLLLALGELKSVGTASVYRDNALHWTARAYLQLVPPACTAPRTGDAAPASACEASAALRDGFPASPYLAQTATYLATAGCDCP